MTFRSGDSATDSPYSTCRSDSAQRGRASIVTGPSSFDSVYWRCLRLFAAGSRQLLQAVRERGLALGEARACGLGLALGRRESLLCLLGAGLGLGLGCFRLGHCLLG